MNSPITSPCAAVLTSSPTITLIPSAFANASRAPRDLVVVGDGDRAQPARARLSEQYLDRGRAVVGVVGVHVQVDVDQGPLDQPLAHRRRVAGRRGVAPTRPSVDALELVGHARKANASRGAPRLLEQPRAQRARRSRLAPGAPPASARRQARTRARSAPPRAARRRREPRATRRDDPARQRADQHAGGRPRRLRRRARARRRPQAPAAVITPASTNRTRSRSRALSVAGGAQRPLRPDRRAPRLARRRQPQRPQEGAQRRALLLARTSTQLDDLRWSERACVTGSAAGRDTRYSAGKNRSISSRGGDVGGDARVEPAEQQPRQRPPELGREDPLGRHVEGADVQRPRVAQRDARGARRERLVDVHEVERQRPSSASSIVRATSTGSEAARRRVGANGSTSPTPSTSGAASARAEQRLRVPAQRPAGLADELSDCDGATTSTRCPRLPARGRAAPT